MNVMYLKIWPKKAKNYDFLMSFQNIKSRKYFLNQHLLLNVSKMQ